MRKFLSTNSRRSRFRSIAASNETARGAIVDLLAALNSFGVAVVSLAVRHVQFLDDLGQTMQALAVQQAKNQDSLARILDRVDTLIHALGERKGGAR